MYQPDHKAGSTAVTCISNWQDLFNIFQKEAKEKRTTLIPSSRRIYPMLLIHIHNWTHLHNKPVTINSSSYCQPLDSEDECMMIAVYSHSVFAVYPPALLMSLIFELEYVQRFQFWLRNTIKETSWILPLPFCSGHIGHNAMADLVYEVSVSHIIICMEGLLWNVSHVCNNVYTYIPTADKHSDISYNYN